MKILAGLNFFNWLLQTQCYTNICLRMYVLSANLYIFLKIKKIYFTESALIQRKFETLHSQMIEIWWISRSQAEFSQVKNGLCTFHLLRKYWYKSSKLCFYYYITSWAAESNLNRATAQDTSQNAEKIKTLNKICAFPESFLVGKSNQEPNKDQTFVTKSTLHRGHAQ